MPLGLHSLAVASTAGISRSVAPPARRLLLIEQMSKRQRSQARRHSGPGRHDDSAKSVNDPCGASWSSSSQFNQRRGRHCWQRASGRDPPRRSWCGSRLGGAWRSSERWASRKRRAALARLASGARLMASRKACRDAGIFTVDRRFRSRKSLIKTARRASAHGR